MNAGLAKLIPQYLVYSSGAVISAKNVCCSADILC
jgi:hypothetical protein